MKERCLGSIKLYSITAPLCDPDSLIYPDHFCLKERIAVVSPRSTSKVAQIKGQKTSM